MEICVFSRTYASKDVDETFRQIKQAGITHTQFNFQNAGLTPLPEEIPQEVINRINAAKKKYGITIDSLTGTFNMIDPNTKKRKKAIVQFEKQCEAAQKIGARVVSLCSGSKNPKDKWAWDDLNDSSEAWNDLIDTTRQILVFAEKYDVILAVETETGNIIHNAKLARRYLDEIDSPRLKMIMDGINLLYPQDVEHQHEIIDEAFALLKDDIVSVHVKDFVIGHPENLLGPGMGSLDFPYYISKLKEINWDGCLIMHGLTEEQVIDGKEYLERLYNA